MAGTGIYKDIATRTGGDIYLGIVGPVRTGKSTFIKKFMETLVLPNIAGEYRRERATDELPQSAAGKTIMTTEPKFIPEEAVQIELEDNAVMNVRLIDCVGYIVPSSIGYIENAQPRMVRTPWFREPIPFNEAAEYGTRKVIREHSTIGLLITTDGSITGIPREEYEISEQRIVAELKELEKPFAVILNSLHPQGEQTRALARQMEESYGVPVLPLSCIDLCEEDIKNILSRLLFTFPLKEIRVELPGWINTLEKEHWLKSSVFGHISQAAAGIRQISQVRQAVEQMAECKEAERVEIRQIDLGSGAARLGVTIPNGLFYRILGEKTGLEIDGESGLLPCMIELARIKEEYAKIEPALREVEATGYGIVMPTLKELTLEEPEIVRQGGKYGVRLRAGAPSIHLMRANITTEVSPIVGSEKQSEELVMYLLRGFEENPADIWDSNIFGKSLHELVNEGLHNKLYRMPQDARTRIQETVERIINEGCSGLICIIL